MTYSINFQSVDVISIYMRMYSYLPDFRLFIYVYIYELIFLVWSVGEVVYAQKLYIPPARPPSENS